MGHKPWPDKRKSNGKRDARREPAQQLCSPQARFLLPCSEHSEPETRLVKIENAKFVAAPADLVWGAKAIGAYLGRSEKAAFQMLEQSRVPGAKKVAGRWGMHVPTFLASFQPTTAPCASVAA